MDEDDSQGHEKQAEPLLWAKELVDQNRTEYGRRDDLDLRQHQVRKHVQIICTDALTGCGKGVKNRRNGGLVVAV